MTEQAPGLSSAAKKLWHGKKPEERWWQRGSLWKNLGIYGAGLVAAWASVWIARNVIQVEQPEYGAKATPKDYYPPLVTAMGAVLLLASIAWTQIRLVRGPGSVDAGDADVVKALLVSFGFVATLAGVSADSSLGLCGLLITLGAAVLMVILLATALFGTAIRRAHLARNAR